MTEARTSGNKAAGAVAAAASTAALACGVCCVLPFALPAAVLGSVGGILAWFADSYRWLAPVALIAVAGGWTWVGYRSWRSHRSPARSTVGVMMFATITMAAAWAWPMFESTIIAVVSR